MNIVVELVDRLGAWMGNIIRDEKLDGYRSLVVAICQNSASLSI
jgi:hypothetical protein